MVWGELMNCKDCRFWAGNLNDDDELESLAAAGPSYITGPMFGCVHFSPIALEAPQASRHDLFD